MTGELATLFEGHEVRTLERAGEPWFPIADLALAWGMDRTTPHKILMRNSEAFRGFVCSAGDCDKMSPSDTGFCVNERGLYLLIGKITTGKLKNQEAAAAILRFQRWVPSLIQQYRKKEVVQVQPAVRTIEAELQRAKMLATETGGDLKAFQAVALKKCGMPEYIEALKAPSLIHGEAGTWLNPTQIGERCGLNAREVNSYLYNHGFQYPEGPVWRLQPKGEEYGEEYWFEATSGHREIRIRWRESILFASGLKRQEAEYPALAPARA